VSELKKDDEIVFQILEMHIEGLKGLPCSLFIEEMD